MGPELQFVWDACPFVILPSFFKFTFPLLKYLRGNVFEREFESMPGKKTKFLSDCKSMVLNKRDFPRTWEVTSLSTPRGGSRNDGLPKLDDL